MNYISVFPTVGAIIGLVLGIIFWMDEKAFDYPGFHISVHVVLTFFVFPMFGMFIGTFINAGIVVLFGINNLGLANILIVIIVLISLSIIYIEEIKKFIKKNKKSK